MGKFITGKALIKQSDIDGIWYTLHNQLYQDDDKRLLFVPRFFLTDGYTINNLLAPLAGGKMQWDIRPSVEHDIECKYHCVIEVKVTLDFLIASGIVRDIEKDGKKITVCENIPIEYLSVEKTTFNQTNCRFKRMMKAVGCIKNWRINMMRFAVNFNIGWLFTKNELKLENLYKEFI